jgi:hypothetical protein
LPNETAEEKKAYPALNTAQHIHVPSGIQCHIPSQTEQIATHTCQFIKMRFPHLKNSRMTQCGQIMKECQYKHRNGLQSVIGEHT